LLRPTCLTPDLFYQGVDMTGFRMMLPLLAFLIAIPAARAETSSASGKEAPDCRAVATEIASAAGARLDHISRSGTFAVLRHHDFQQLTVTCPKPGGSASIEGDLQSAFPQDGYFRALAAAGSVLVAEPAAEVEAALRRCYQSATHDNDETGLVQTGSLHVECEAYAREDGNMMMVISRTPESTSLPARYRGAPSPLYHAFIGPTE
jgi:hypothetical protein